ncbi:sensor histidine kinase [Chitinophaga sp. NPDC101104]|uniref:sensor histidine kinase n=1 Tax=Chitinophaga sp. NPDC101104 TaxID=3390561 RepID=UPI003D06D288
MIKIFGRDITLLQAQLAVWLIVALTTFSSYLQTADPVWAAYSAGINLLCAAAIIYGNALWLMPRLLHKGRKVAYALAVLALLTLVCFIRVTARYHMLRLLLPDAKDQSTPIQLYTLFAVSSLTTYLFSVIFRLAMDYFTVRKEQERLRQYTAEVERDLLKAQVQPHFLFNTLNNIYFVAQRQSPETAELLAKLSNIMRYFVDQAHKKAIRLKTDIQFILDYIDLEKMRMHRPLQTNIRVDGEPGQIKIPPMLMIPLIENVFKHGVNKRSDNNLLELHIQVLPASLEINVRNRLMNERFPDRAGSGLKNLRARLQLLYGSSFRLTAMETGDYYSVHLMIPL